MTIDKFNKLTIKEREKCVQDYLNYLEAEGVAIKMSNGKYRMKTQKEIQKELDNIVNN